MADKIGPGVVILIVGPSGAGKDALLEGLRNQAGPHLHFAERVISRPSHAAEAHASATKADMSRALNQGKFALSWQAHDLTYGIRVSIDDHIRAGQTVIFNASRTVIPDARRRYANTAVVLVDAPLKIRAARLAARGRETAQEIEQRLQRTVDLDPAMVDARVANDTDLEIGVERLAATVESVLSSFF